MTGTMDGEEWLEKLAGLADDGARRDFFAVRQELRSPETAEKISREVLRRLRIDLGQAERLVAAGAWLAGELGDERCRALALKDSAHLHFLGSRYQEALAGYRGAAEIFRGLGAEVDAAVALSTSQQSLAYLGRYDEAFAAAAEAREVFERHGDALLLARLDSNQGNVLVRLDRNAEARERYEAALAVFRRRGDPQDMAAALLNIGVSSIELSDHPRALAAYRELSAHCARHELPLIGARADYNVAYLYFQRSEYARAIELYRLTRERCRRLGDLPYELALCDLDEAEIDLELNLAGEGDRLAGRAREAFDQLGMTYEAGKALVFQAIAAGQSGDAELALKLLADARARFVEQANPLRPAMIDLYRASILLRTERPRQAGELARQALEVFAGARLERPAGLAELLAAQARLELGELEAAHAGCRRAIGAFETVYARALLSRACFVLGRIEEARGEGDAAFGAYRRALATLELLRGHLRGDELKIAFLSDKLEVYESLVSMTLERQPDAAGRAAAFALIEQAKSRALADLLAFRSFALPGSVAGAAAAAERTRRRREELNWCYHEIHRRELELTPDGGEDAARAARKIETLRRRSRGLEQRLLEALAELHAQDAELGSLQGAGALDLESIRAALPPGALLLEYFEAGGRLYACLLDRKRLAVRAVAGAARVRELLNLLQFQLSKLRLGGDFVKRFALRMHRATLGHLSALYAELIAPIADELEAEHLVVVPHGPLHYLPFHALFDGEHHLYERFAISYAPSASVFAMCRRRAGGRQRDALIFGVPDPQAPHIADEVEAVARALPDAQVFLGEAADEDRLRALGPGCRLVHIATHGIFRLDSPMFSAVQLGSSRLTLFDLYHLELGAELVVLSGCGTGMHVIEGGDELIGLTRGLLYAGARSVLVTLWDVHDLSTSRFMAALYRHLETCDNRAEAVRRAMAELHVSNPHPYYWAPFVLIGDPFQDY